MHRRDAVYESRIRRDVVRVRVIITFHAHSLGCIETRARDPSPRAIEVEARLSATRVSFVLVSRRGERARERREGAEWKSRVTTIPLLLLRQREREIERSGRDF